MHTMRKNKDEKECLDLENDNDNESNASNYTLKSFNDLFHF